MLEQGKIIRAAYGTGRAWHKVLADQSKSHMVELSKKMDDRQVERTLCKMRRISYLAETFGDVLYDELEIRDRDKKINCV